MNLFTTGSLSKLTDPQIHSDSDLKLSSGNLGLTGINEFRKFHVCNIACKALGFDSMIEEEEEVEVSCSSSLKRKRTRKVIDIDENLEAQNEDNHPYVDDEKDEDYVISSGSATKEVDKL